MKVFEEVDKVKITADDVADIEEKINSFKDFDLSLSNYPEFLKDISSILSALNDLVKTRLASLSEKDKVLEKILNSTAFEKYKKNIEDTILYRIYQRLDEKTIDLLYLVTYLYFSVKLYNLQYEKSSNLFLRVKDREIEFLKLKDNFHQQKQELEELKRKVEEYAENETNLEELKEKLRVKEDEISELKRKIERLEWEKSNLIQKNEELLFECRMLGKSREQQYENKKEETTEQTETENAEEEEEPKTETEPPPSWDGFV